MRDRQVVITPSDHQYDQLVAHLDLLRAAGAESNTAAVLDAVREKVDRLREHELREAA